MPPKPKSKSKAISKNKKTAAPAKAKFAKSTRESVAVKTLSSLPALPSNLRAGFRAAFTDEQCDAWGEKTKAANVIQEAEKWIATMAKALKDDTDVAYSRRRLAFLSELLVLLQDELESTKDASSHELRRTRAAALQVANNARRDLARRLRAVAGGQQRIIEDIQRAAPQSDSSVVDVQESLTALIDVAVKLRRNDVLEAMANDAGLTQDRLNSAYAALESLTGARDVALNAAAYEGDAPTVNRIEGRILREMKLAQRLFNEARAEGVNVPALLPGPSLAAIFRKYDAAEPTSPAPAPTA